MARGGPPVPLSGVVGQGVRFEGDLVHEGRVRVDGEFAGRVYSEDVFEIGPTGTVRGEADVARAVVAGRFEGALRVRELLVVEETAVIEGKLDVGVLDLRPGARLRGEVRVAGEELP